MVIHKQQLPIREGNRVSVQFNCWANVLSCGFQGESFVIWYETDSNRPGENLKDFYVLRTGEEFTPHRNMKFIGTANDVSDPSFPFVIHLYEIIP